MAEIDDLRREVGLLRDSKRLLRAVFDGALEPIVLTDRDGKYVDANPAACALYRVPREQIVGHSIAELVGANLVTQDGYVTFRAQGHVQGRFKLERPEGTRLLEYSSVADVAPGVDLSVMRDITDRTTAEEASRASLRLLEESQALAHVGSWTSGIGPGEAIDWTAECYRIFGVPVGTPITVTAFQACVHPDDRERVLRASRQATERGVPYDIEHRIRRPDGTVRWVHERAVVERDTGGQPTRMIGTVEDVTESHLAVEALQDSEEGFRQLAAKLGESEALLRITGQAARLGGWSLSLPDRRVTWSDEVCAILEFPAGTVPSLAEAIDMYAPESRDIIRRQVESCAIDGTPFDLELRAVTASGRTLWVRAIGRAMRDATGAVTGLHGAFQDIDDRRRLEEQFRQAQKMEAVGRLAGGVAHDFNNLLSVVLCYSELALESLRPGDPLRANVEEIHRAGERANGLTRQLLAFSRQQVLEPRVTNLGEVVDHMKAMLGRLLGEDIELSVLADPGVGSVLVDPSQMEQVVMNLAINARDAMPAGGKLRIHVANVLVAAGHPGKPVDVPPGHFVRLAVTDNGTGMSEATRARLFEPFFTTKELGKGTGLGLATVFGIVRQSGGYLSVHSELQRGTTFTVYLPRTHRVATAPVSITPGSALDGSETILLVEDEQQVREVASAILRKHGYHVLETPDGGQALLVASDRAARIDLLLSDVIMPRVGGRKLAESLSRDRPEMKILFVSGYTDDAIIQHGVLEEDVAFLQKPFTPLALLRKVRDVLDAPPRQP